MVVYFTEQKGGLIKPRELQIAFERKIMLMDPSLRDAEKLTSDTIFAFLNAAQDRYYEQLYQQFDQIESVGRMQFRNSDLLKGFIMNLIYQVITNIISNQIVLLKTLIFK